MQPLLCVCRHAKSLQLCRILCDRMDPCPPDSSAYGILQARKLEWVAMPFSRESSPTRDRTCISYCLLRWQAGSLPLAPPGKSTEKRKYPCGLHPQDLARAYILARSKANYIMCQLDINRLEVNEAGWTGTERDGGLRQRP